jgi:CheY-like chemotaxis protein
VRRLARDILQQVGYTVLEAANSHEALEICRHNPASIQVLLTDVIMPQMSGRELAERIDRVRPGVKILYMSGYTDDALGPRALLAGDRVLLPKPFTPEMLASKVRAVLDSQA